jgi:phage portal protein BeeE
MTTLGQGVGSLTNAFREGFLQKSTWDQLERIWGSTLGGSTSSRKRSANVQLREFQSWIYVILTTIYGRTSTVPWNLKVKRPDNTLDDLPNQFTHPMFNLMMNPNPFMSGTFFQQIIQTYLDLTGMAFVWKIKNGLNRPAELWPLNTAEFIDFDLGSSTKDFIKGYKFNNMSFDKSEIVYLYYPNPNPTFFSSTNSQAQHRLLASIIGMSPIQAMARTVDIEKYIEIYERDFFENNARPDVVLTADPGTHFDDEARKQFLAKWKQSHQGPRRNWDPTVLSKMTIEILKGNNKDFQLFKLAGWTKDMLFATYSVPEAKAGLVKDVNRANAIGTDITFNSECIQPRLNLWDESFTQQLAVDFDERLVLQHDNPVPSDREFQLEEDDKNLANRSKTVNEIRASRGDDPVPWGDSPFVPLNLIQVGSSPPEEEPEPEEPEEIEEGKHVDGNCKCYGEGWLTEKENKQIEEEEEGKLYKEWEQRVEMEVATRKAYSQVRAKYPEAEIISVSQSTIRIRDKDGIKDIPILFDDDKNIIDWIRKNKDNIEFVRKEDNFNPWVDSKQAKRVLEQLKAEDDPLCKQCKDTGLEVAVTKNGRLWWPSTKEHPDFCPYCKGRDGFVLLGERLKSLPDISIKKNWLDEPARRDAYWKVFDARARKHERMWVKEMRRLFKNQERVVLAQLNQAAPRIEGQFNGWSKRKINAYIKQNAELVNEILFDEKKQTKLFAEGGEPLIRETLKDSGDAMMVDLGVDIGFDITDENVVNYIKGRANQYSKQVVGTTHDELKKTLREGFKEGESINKLRDRVKHLYDIKQNSGAVRIARTETISAGNAGALEGMDQSGVVDEKEWVSSRDNRVRDSHKHPLDTQVVGLREEFTSRDGNTAQHPGGFGIAEEDIQCRCSIAAVVEV